VFESSSIELKSIRLGVLSFSLDDIISEHSEWVKPVSDEIAIDITLFSSDLMFFLSFEKTSVFFALDPDLVSLPDPPDLLLVFLAFPELDFFLSDDFKVLPVEISADILFLLPEPDWFIPSLVRFE
jgi:hypothetical protein